MRKVIHFNLTRRVLWSTGRRDRCVSRTGELKTLCKSRRVARAPRKPHTEVEEIEIRVSQNRSITQQQRERRTWFISALYTRGQIQKKGDQTCLSRLRWFFANPSWNHRPHIDWRLKCKSTSALSPRRLRGASGRVNESTSSCETDGDARGNSENARRVGRFSSGPSGTRDGFSSRMRGEIAASGPSQKTARVEKPPAGALRSDHHRLVESFLRPTMKAEEGVERCIGVLGAPTTGHWRNAVGRLEAPNRERERHARE